jgi:hypothetical protein
VSRETQASSRRADPYPERGSELWLLFCVDAHLGPAADEPGRALAVHPRTLADPRVPQPHGQRLAALVTDQPDRRPADLVLLSDVAAELAEAGESFERPALDWEGVVEAVTRLHARGQVKALEFAGLPAEEVALLTGVPPAVVGRRGRCCGTGCAGGCCGPASAGITRAARGSATVSRFSNAQKYRSSVQQSPFFWLVLPGFLVLIALSL